MVFVPYKIFMETNLFSGWRIAFDNSQIVKHDLLKPASYTV